MVGSVQRLSRVLVDEVSPKAALFEDTPMEVSDGKVSDGKADVRRESLKREDSLLAPTGETLKSISLALVKSLILLFCVTSFAASVFSHAEMPKEMRAARKARVTLRRIQQKYNMSDADVRDLADAQISKPRCGRCSARSSPAVTGAFSNPRSRRSRPFPRPRRVRRPRR